MQTVNEEELLANLNKILAAKKWDDLRRYLDPKLFGMVKTGNLFRVLAKIAEILSSSEYADIPENVIAILLKCLGNSCLQAYKHEDHELQPYEEDKYNSRIYSVLANKSEDCGTYSPYTEVIGWTTEYILSHEVVKTENETEILRLSIQFLCNYFTFFCEDGPLRDCKSVLRYLNNSNLKAAVVAHIQSENISLARASCIFIHNALKKYKAESFTMTELKDICLKLLKRGKDLKCAEEALMLVLNIESTLRDIYKDISMEDRLYLLELIYSSVQEAAYVEKNETKLSISHDLVHFISERFRRRSDLILKTVDTYLNNMEPTEVIILLDILTALTSSNSEELAILQQDTSLLINCSYLLKSMHMIGKESENCFTPVQRLSDVAPAGRAAEQLDSVRSTENTRKRESSLESHPAFGFKAALIRVIGNLSYKNKACQDLLREMDVIPLLLDCCNIDARNPLIIQWTILAVRNLCEGNPENQEVIRNCTKIGIIDNAVLKEFGLTLHEEEDGKSVGIVPLIRNTSK